MGKQDSMLIRHQNNEGICNLLHILTAANIFHLKQGSYFAVSSPDHH